MLLEINNAYFNEIWTIENVIIYCDLAHYIKMCYIVRA